MDTSIPLCSAAAVVLVSLALTLTVVLPFATGLFDSDSCL